MNLESLIINLSNRQKDIFFIQAGACDGFMADPIKNFIRPLHWKGIFFRTRWILPESSTRNVYRHKRQIYF